MGNVNTIIPQEGLGHPEPYYRGVTAAREGRFTLSEVYFVQAMKRHPGREFWEALLDALSPGVQTSKSPGTSPSKQSGGIVAQGLQMSLMQPQHRTDIDNTGTSAVPNRNEWTPVPASPEEAATAELDDTSPRGVRFIQQPEAPVLSLDSSPAERVDVALPLGDHLKDVLDFARLLADIALTYLDLLATTPHPEKVLALAARYSIAVVTHSQALLHCLTLWKDENLCDGLGFVDYAGRRSQASQAALREAEVLTVGEQVQGARTGDGEGVVGGRGYSVGHRKASPAASRCFTLASVEATCRYYFLSFTVNYAVLLMKSMGTMPDEKRRVQVFTNTVSHLDAVFELMHDVANENPGEYLSKVILELFPAPSAASSRNPASSGAISLGPVGSHLLLVDNGQHRHLYSCASPWTPFQSGMVPLALARRVRLVLVENSRDSLPVRLTSPGQRMSYHYQSWLTKAIFLAVPGCSPYLLTRALPGFVPGPGTLAHKTEMLQRNVDAPAGPSSPSAQDVASVSAAEQHAQRAGSARGPTESMTESQKKALTKKLKKVVRQNGRRMNSDLDFADERTFVMLSQNEACLVGGSALVNSAQLYNALGQMEATMSYAGAAVALAAALSGPDSVEVQMVSLVLNGGLRE